MMSVSKLGAAALAMACLHLSQGARIGGGDPGDEEIGGGDPGDEEPMVAPFLGDEQVDGAQLVAASQATQDKHTNIIDYVGGAYTSIDASQAWSNLLKTARGILMAKEEVEMAFKLGRDKTFFTNSRVIRRFGSSSQTYQSIPYTSIKAFTITTWDRIENTNLVLHTGVHSNDGTLNIKFSESSGGPNIFDVSGYFTRKITGAEVSSRAPDAKTIAKQIQQFVNGIRDNVKEKIDVTATLKAMSFLGENEMVQAVFKVSRPRPKIVEAVRERQRRQARADLIVITSKRVVRVQVHRRNSNIDITTIPNSAIKGFVVTSPSQKVQVPEIKIWTNIPSLPSLQQEVLQAVDVELILKLLSSAVTGATQAEEATSMNEMNQQIGETLNQAGILHALDQEIILNHFWRSENHLVVLTSQRLILADQVVYTHNVKYTILPYRSILAWEIAKVDDGTKLRLFTEMSQADDVRCPTKPKGDDCMSFIEIFLGRDEENVKAIHKLLSFFLLDHSSKLAGTGNFSFDAVQEGSSTPFSSLFNVENDVLEEAFMKAEFLQRGETVSMIHRTHKDVHMWTDKRFVYVKAGSLGSIPYHAIKVFELTVGSNPTVGFQMNMPSFNMYDYKLKGADIEEVVRFVGALLPGSGSASEAATENLNENFKDLLGTEQVEFASKPILDKKSSVRIQTVLTTQRALRVETKRTSSRIIKCITIPYSSARMFVIDKKGVATFHLETLLKKSIAQKFTEGNQTENAVQAWNILSAKTLHLDV